MGKDGEEEKIFLIFFKRTIDNPIDSCYNRFCCESNTT